MRSDMGSFKVTSCEIEGVKIIEPGVHYDERGYFYESYNLRDLEKEGITLPFVQDNQSKSTRGVLRGLHYQKNYPQGKLVRAIQGEIFDAVVDIRKDSETFGKWFGITLSASNKKQLYVPAGMAHGYLVLSDEAEFCYKCTEYYHPEDEGGLLWNDPEIGIEWPLDGLGEIIQNSRDRGFERISELRKKILI